MKYKTKNISDRLLNLIEYLGMTQKEFAEHCDLHQQAINRLVKDKDANPGGKMLASIKNAFPLININWLLFGEGNMMAGVVAGSKLDPIICIPKHATKEYCSTGFNKEANFDYFPIYNKINNSDNMQAFEVSETNMEPYLKVGDFILCEKVELEDAIKFSGQTAFMVAGKHSGIYMISCDGEVVVASSVNSFDKDKEIPLEEVTELWLMKEYKSARTP
jgi:transcriptional regulator with XRE-family HTH domain